MLIKYDVGWGQVCENACGQFIVNKNLDLIELPNPIPPPPYPQGATSFQNGWVPGWFVSHGSPHHIKFDPNLNGSLGHCILFWDEQEGAEIPCFIPSGNEGMFTELTLSSLDEFNIFCLSMEVKTIDCFSLPIEIGFTVSLTSGLNPLMPNDDSQIPAPIVTQELMLIDEIIDVRGTYQYNTQFQPGLTPNLTQLWFNGVNQNSVGSTPIQFKNIQLDCTTTSLTEVIAEVNGTTVSFEATNASLNHPFEEFTWDFGDGNTSTDENPIHTYQNSGTYEVCLEIINDTGCCASRCISVCVNETPEITIRENFCSNYTFSIENPDPSMSYTWNISGGSPSTGTGTMFSTVISENGLYIISVTGQNSCGSESATKIVGVACSLEPPTCINQRNCVSIGENINSVTLLSTLILGDHPVIPSEPRFFAREIQNLCFSVEGKLIIDVAQVFFVNTNWFMGPGSSIEITPNGFWGSRYFINSHLQGCDQMWRGIILNADTPGGFFGTGGLSLTRTTIEDAFRGVELQNNTSFISYNSNYFDNSFGVFVGGNELKNIHTNIQGSVFENKGNLLSPYTGQPSWSNINRFGIHASGMSRMNVISTSNNKNKFKNLQTGIWVNNVELKASHNEFEDNQNISSVGIRIGGVPAHVEIVNGNVFHNLLQSIYLVDNPNRSVVHILNNTFTNTRNANQGLIGVYVQRSPFTALTIGVYNSFDYINGRCVYVQGGLSGLTLNDNTVKISGTVLQPFRIDNVQNTSKIERNDFKVQGSVGYLGTCISLLNCRKLSVIDNEMSGTTNSVGASCLTMHGSNKCLIRGNRVLFNHGSAAFIIWGTETTENGFCCNTATSPAKPNFRSFYFSGENGMSFIRQNDIYSLYLDGNFGPQRNAGNNWLGIGNFASLANGDFIKATDNLFKVNQNVLGALPSGILPSSISSDWFTFNGTHPICSTSPTCDIPLFFNDIDDPDLTYDGPDPQDTIIVIVDPARPSCEALIDLYDRLESIDSVSNPIAYWSVISLINKWKIWKGSAWIESCLDSVVTFNIDITPWYDVEKEKDKIYHVDEVIRQEMAPIMQVVYDLNDQLDTVSVDSTMVLPPHVVIWYDSLKNALDSLKVLNEQIQQDILDKASSLIAQVNALPTPLPFLVDRKKVWQVEMKYLSGGLGSITSGEWAQIRIIADKCPLTDGQAVYEAMSLLHLIDEETEINANCSPSTPRSKKTSKLKQISVFPNPGKGFFTFELPTNILSDQCAIYDMSGRKVWDAVLIRGNHTLQVDLQHLKAGLYIYVFKNGETLVHQGKLVIIE